MSEESLSSLIKNLEICRLCLNITGNKINIFSDDFPKMLEVLTGIKISNEDNLPKISCLKCALEVKSAILTRRKIIKSHRAFTSTAAKNKTIINLDDSDDNHDNGDVNEERKVESSPIKKLETLQKLDLNPEKKVEKIQELKLATNTQYLKKLRSFDLSKNKSLDSSSQTVLDNVSISDKRLPVVRCKIPLSTRKRKAFDVPIPLSPRRKSILERKQKVRREIEKMMENRRKIKIDVDKLTEEAGDVETQGRKPRVYYCSECKIKFPKYCLYWNHMARHNHKKCHICGKIVQAVYMKKHMIIHSSDQAVCEMCGFASKNSSSLRMHYAYHHRGPKPMCDECGKEFLTKTKLMYHKKKYHMNQKDFKCQICGKAFHLKIYLDKHIQAKHLKVRPHVCEFCGKGFCSRDGLKTHRRQHTNEAPYECHLCYERFRQKVSLRGHLKSKHDIQEEENFFCNVCGKGYASLMALEIHERVHNEVKCPHPRCTDSFANDDYLAAHLKTDHEDESPINSLIGY